MSISIQMSIGPGLGRRCRLGEKAVMAEFQGSIWPDDQSIAAVLACLILISDPVVAGY